MNSCKRKTCPAFAKGDGYQYCCALCRNVDIQASILERKGESASMTERSAFLGLVDAVDMWRTAVMAGNRETYAQDAT